MSVLIKGMEMPKSCLECALNSGERCEATKNYCLYRTRPTHCPLIELPPHGRLIDADKVMAALSDMAKEYPKNPLDSIGGYMIFKVRGAIEKLPTIIEAEGVSG